MMFMKYLLIFLFLFSINLNFKADDIKENPEFTDEERKAIIELLEKSLEKNRKVREIEEQVDNKGLLCSQPANKYNFSNSEVDKFIYSVIYFEDGNAYLVDIMRNYTPSGVSKRYIDDNIYLTLKSLGRYKTNLDTITFNHREGDWKFDYSTLNRKTLVLHISWDLVDNNTNRYIYSSDKDDLILLSKKTYETYITRKKLYSRNIHNKLNCIDCAKPNDCDVLNNWEEIENIFENKIKKIKVELKKNKI